jgi:hypothetical protein
LTGPLPLGLGATLMVLLAGFLFLAVNPCPHLRKFLSGSVDTASDLGVQVAGRLLERYYSNT